MTGVDAGGGWLIFGLPPSELAFHPAENNQSRHELYFMCEDIRATVRTLEARQVNCSAVSDEGWGLLTHIELPSGARVGVYQPKHPTATASPSSGK